MNLLCIQASANYFAGIARVTEYIWISQLDKYSNCVYNDMGLEWYKYVEGQFAENLSSIFSSTS